MSVSRLVMEVDVTAVADVGEAAHVTAEVLLPDTGTPPALLFACVPGGGMNRRYFDLPTPAGEAEVSFARAMAAHGHAVALIDPLGAGDSSCPSDAFRLHPDRMAEAAGVAACAVLDALRAGTLDQRCPPAPAIRSVGVGHSLGALLTIVEQARSGLHAGVALFGFGTAGIPAHLTPEDMALDPAFARANLVALARQRHAAPWIELTPPESRRAVSAASAIGRVMMTPSLMAMLPDMVAQDAAAIDVPVLLAFGDGDLHPTPRDAPLAYRSAHEITLLVLPDTRHNHFIYPTRTRLFAQTARWAEGLP